jgi:cytochrome c oxidase subunit IV
MTSHIESLKVYFVIFFSLLTLTAVTAAVAFVDLGPFNIYVAMTIAVVKALLVVMFFMHLRYSSSLTKLFVCAGILWFAILISLTTSDFFTRAWQGRSDGWVPIEEATPDPRHVTAH